MQAGREIRVMVKPDEIRDDDAMLHGARPRQADRGRDGVPGPGQGHDRAREPRGGLREVARESAPRPPGAGAGRVLVSEPATSHARRDRSGGPFVVRADAVGAARRRAQCIDWRAMSETAQVTVREARPDEIEAARRRPASAFTRVALELGFDAADAPAGARDRRGGPRAARAERGGRLLVAVEPATATLVGTVRGVPGESGTRRGRPPGGRGRLGGPRHRPRAHGRAGGRASRRPSASSCSPAATPWARCTCTTRSATGSCATRRS